MSLVFMCINISVSDHRLASSEANPGMPAVQKKIGRGLKVDVGSTNPPPSSFSFYPPLP
ncbi:MAG: hypothetical protein KF734_14685 [Saprospiraceae bacterium]|nr:hypothetical protein [Saprospiraceae bacterium]